MGFIKDFIQNYFLNSSEERAAARIHTQTYDLAEQGKYAEAAEINARYALKRLKDNELIYCSYCEYAFELWISAEEPEKALREARNILRIYTDNDGKWLKYDSVNPDDLITMVSKLFAAGYSAEAAVFAGEVNDQLEKHALPIRCAAVPVRKNIFPSSCSNCGANISSSPYHDTIQCSYCSVVIYAVNAAAPSG